MRNVLKRSTAILMMAAVMITMSFALTGEDTFAASKAPAKPKITKATVVNNNAVQLKWSKAKNAAKYKVYRKKAGGKFVLVKTTTKRSFQNKKLAYGTKYTYKVTAISKTGKKNTSKVKVVYTKPAKPVITAKVYDNNNVKVTWKAAKGAVKYKVYRKKADGKFVLVKTTTKKTYESKELAYSTKYTYKVRAVSKAGKTNTSLTRTVVTGAKAAVPETPVTPDEPVVPDTPATPGDSNSPAVPSQPATPDCAVVGHNYQLVKVTGPICAANGYDEYKCSRCDATKQETTSAMLGHAWKVTNTVDSTTTAEGCTYYMCSRCQELKTETIPKKDASAEPNTPAVPSEPSVPAEPETPVTPSEPVTPEQPAERTVTVKIPIYETKTVYWIKYKGEIIFKTSDPQAFTDKQTECWSQGMQISYGTNGSGAEYQIILGYEEDIFTESEYNYLLENSDIGKMPGIIVIWND